MAGVAEGQSERIVSKSHPKRGIEKGPASYKEGKGLSLFLAQADLRRQMRAPFSAVACQFSADDW